MKQIRPQTNHSSRKPRNSRRGVHRKPEESFTFNEADDRIFDIFRNHQFEYPHEKRHQLVKFYQLLMENQINNNFTRLLKIRDVAIKHFIDCLIVPRIIRLEFPLLDVGTGPGFPGIPLKIEYPDQRVILAEGVQKRVEFLKHVRETLQLKELDIIGRNVDEDFVYPVQAAITRAVEDITLTLGHVSQSVQVGGCVILMKGPNVDGELQKAQEKWREFYRLEKDASYTLPLTTHHRRLLVFRKIKEVSREAVLK